jgi:hypothetical protein
MGVDIHDILQVRKDGVWKTVCQNLFNGRSYKLFSVLAGVRSIDDDEQLKPCAGLPKDYDFYMSGQDTLAFDGEYWMGFFNFTYYTLAELTVYKERLERGEDGEVSLEYIFLTAYEYAPGCNPEDIRYVCGFDA